MRDEVTDADADGETENASEEEVGAEITFSGRKLSVKSAAFPFVRPPVFPSSLLALARLPVIRPSLPSPPSIARPFAVRVSRLGEIYARVRKAASLPVSPGTGSRGKIPCVFLQRRPTHRWKRNRGSDTLFASLCRDPLHRLDAVWTLRFASAGVL